VKGARWREARRLRQRDGFFFSHPSFLRERERRGDEDLIEEDAGGGKGCTNKKLRQKKKRRPVEFEEDAPPAWVEQGIVIGVGLRDLLARLCDLFIYLFDCFIYWTSSSSHSQTTPRPRVHSATTAHLLHLPSARALNP